MGDENARLRATMTCPPVHAVALVCHPDARSDAVLGVRARVARSSDGTLAVRYAVDANLDRLRVPPPGTPRIAEGLWRHTCCELFVARNGSPGYHEFNFGPSGEWAAYAFARYRDGHVLADEELNPAITVRSTGGNLELDARVRLDRLSPIHPTVRLSLAVSAVVEDDSGALSYWALRHPPGKPDFHHPDAFAMEIDEVRN